MEDISESCGFYRRQASNRISLKKGADSLQDEQLKGFEQDLTFKAAVTL
jgi:hypothetical protein